MTDKELIDALLSRNEPLLEEAAARIDYLTQQSARIEFAIAAEKLFWNAPIPRDPQLTIGTL